MAQIWSHNSRSSLDDEEAGRIRKEATRSSVVEMLERNNGEDDAGYYSDVDSISWSGSHYHDSGMHGKSSGGVKSKKKQWSEDRR
jgi:hypothetical protein